jgi:hypothetical protein
MTRLAVLAVAFSGAAFALGAGAAGANDPPDASLVARPKVVQFGGHFNDVYRSVVNQCTVGIIERSNQPVVLPTVKERQTQIDCIGFNYAGKFRKAHFQFADDILDVVVIETDADEEQALRKALIQHYGKPSQVAKGDTVFLDDGVALRTGPHSVTFFSDRLKGRYGSF